MKYLKHCHCGWESETGRLSTPGQRSNLAVMSAGIINIHYHTIPSKILLEESSNSMGQYSTHNSNSNT